MYFIDPGYIGLYVWKVIKKRKPNLASQLEDVALGIRLGELMWHEVCGYEWGMAEVFGKSLHVALYLPFPQVHIEKCVC